MHTYTARIALGRPSITDEEVAAAERVLRSGWLVYGPEGRAFEEELAAFTGRRYAAVVSSGTAALHLALLAVAKQRAVHELLIPAFTFPATGSVARFLPQPPRVCLADVDPETLCMPTETALAWLRSRRGPVMLVHQFGLPAPLSDDDEREHGGDVIMDAACAIGARAAMRGRLVCLSFHPRKLLTTGEGGAVLTDDQGLIEELRARRAHGLVAEPGAEVLTMPESGLNYRLPEVASAIGRVQLRRLPGLIARHRELAERYRERLLEAGLEMQKDGPGRVFQTVCVLLPDGVERAALRRTLSDAGIETQIASYGVHRLAAFANCPVFTSDGKLVENRREALPVASRLHEQGLALPLHAELSDADVDRVCATLLRALGR